MKWVCLFFRSIPFGVPLNPPKRVPIQNRTHPYALLQWLLCDVCLGFNIRVATVRFGSVRFLKPVENLSPVSGGYS